MHIDNKQLKAFLADAGLISKVDFEKIESEAKKKDKSINDALVSSGKVSESDLRRVQAYILGIPFVNLKDQKIDSTVLSMIPEPIARKHNVVAFKKSGTELEVAMLDPEDLEAIEFIKKKSNLKILPRLTDTDSIKVVLLQYQKSLSAEFGDIIERETAALKMVAEDAGQEASDEDLKKLAEDLPIVKIVDSLLGHAISQNASDIHIEPYEGELVVRYRIDGILHDAMTLPRSSAAGVVARIKILSSLRLDEKRLPQDGRFKTDREGQKVSFRVSILPTFYGEKIVMRLLPDTVKGFTLEGLGFHGPALETIHENLKRTTGIVLATGPTGSGKTTTLYTMLDILNTPNVNISTIEDPIEYQIPRITQTQVRPDIGLTFASGLRSLVRQDPDIVMVGEIRDEETAGLAVNAALTGHLVLSTVHTNSAAGAIPRLIDMGVLPFLLSSTVNTVIAQRLVRRLAKDRSEYKLSKAEIENLKKHANLERVVQALRDEKIVEKGATIEKITFFKPKPNKEFPDGYSGRQGIHEVMPVNRTIQNLILKSVSSAEIEDQAKSEGMLTMIEDGIFQAAQGITTLEEVFRVATE